MKKYGPFSIQAKTDRPSEADIFIYGDIGASWNEESVTAAKFVRDLQNVDAKVLNVRINSYGGSVSDALAIYNALARNPGTVNTFVDGVAVSAASLIAMAGKTLTMAENAVMMIHGPIAMAAGNAQTMREMADILDKYAQAMAPSYAAKTGKPAMEMLALLTDGEDHWYTAAEAKAAGFVDEISAAVKVAAQFDAVQLCGIPAAAAAFFRSAETMTAEEKAAALAKEAAEAKAKSDKEASDKAAAEAAEKARLAAAPALAAVGSTRTLEQNKEIRAAFEPFMGRDGVRAVYDAALLDPSITVDAARSQLIVALGKDVTPANPTGSFVQMGADESEKFREACSQALLFRIGVASPEAKAKIGQNPYRGYKLPKMAEAAMRLKGKRTEGMSDMEIVAAAFTQSRDDFPILLETTMNKTLQAAYALAPQTWRRFSKVGSVSDFRPNNRYRKGTFGQIYTVGENGEFKNIPIPEGTKTTISAITKGAIINMTRQMMVDDDLGVFTGLGSELGDVAGRQIEIDVYAMLNQNSGAGPTMDDTFVLFSTDHANLAGAGAVPSVITIAAAETALKSQPRKDSAGNTVDYYDFQPPYVFLGGIAIAGSVRVINAAQFDPDTTNKLQKPNQVNGMFRDIIGSPRIQGTDWYVFASEAPVFEVAFLNGNETPFVETQMGFDVDGMRMKVRLDYGIAVADYVGGYSNPGA
ncbi:MAG: ClpP-like prohead protease/major capsid protein fusion protein [Betaproteobacteria bacterium]